MSEEQLREILEAGEQEPCAAYFKGMAEAKRRKLAPFCLKWYKELRKNQFVELKPGTWGRNQLMPAAATAAFATATLAELQKLGWQARPDGDLVFEMIVDRRPPWIGDWVTGLLEENRFRNHWSLVRQLLAAGLIEKPDHPNYLLAMIEGIVGSRGSNSDQKTVEQALREDPTLLEDEVWQLFEREGEGNNSLANWDRSSHGGKWADAFVALIESGDLSRERLLNCSLDALDRDFNHYRAKWFATFHDTLKPTSEEQRGFAERYLQFLSVTAPNIVSWALKKVEKLAKAGELAPDQLIAGLRPVLEARQKGIVKKALKLLARAARQAKESAPAAAAAALRALGHEEADVQSAALDVIDACGDREDLEFVARLAEYADVIAPSERARLSQWLPGPAGTQSPATQSSPNLDAEPIDLKQFDAFDSKLLDLYGVRALIDNLEHGRAAIPSATFDGMDIPRLIPEQRLTPIDDLDELIEVCARVIEDESLIDDAERAIDGITRLCDQKPADFAERTGPLLKRAIQRMQKELAPFCGVSAAGDLCGLVYAWCTGKVLEDKAITKNDHNLLQLEIEGQEKRCYTLNLSKALGFLSRRVLAAARQVALGDSSQLLSTPTHAGGWIDPGEFVRRVNVSGDAELNVTDACQALLRLAPEGRSEALDQLQPTSTEWGSAIRYALGAEDVQFGQTPALWIAAARCRSPWSDDALILQAFPEYGPDAGRAGSYSYECRTRDSGHTDLFVASQPPAGAASDPNCATVILHTQRDIGKDYRWELGGTCGRTIGTVRWTATIWPQARESFFASAAADLAWNLDWWEAHWENKALLEPLLDPGTPLREMGLLLLVLGLAAKDPGEHGLATDIAIRAIEEGRLGADNLGPSLARLLPTGLIRPARWQKRFAEIGRITPVHALVIQQSLQGCCVGDPQAMPREFAKLLDLLKELSIDLGQSISHEACRAFLAKIKGSGKAAKTAKALLALGPDDASRTRELVQLALRQRLAAIQAVGSRQ